MFNVKVIKRSFQQVCIISESPDVGKAKAHVFNGPSFGPEQASGLLQPGQKSPKPLHCEEGMQALVQNNNEEYCATKFGIGNAADQALEWQQAGEIEKQVYCNLQLILWGTVAELYRIDTTAGRTYNF